MTKRLPHLHNKRFLCYTGMETDLIFNKQIELQEFAAFPLLENHGTKNIIRNYYLELIAFAKEHGVGVVLDSVTWAANCARGDKLGYDEFALSEINADAITLMESCVEESQAKFADMPDTLLCGDIGPKDDAYAITNQMSANEAEQFHAVQIKHLSQTNVDFVTAYTIGNVNEAVGMVKAAKMLGMPIVIGFTVETNGCLADGNSLKAAMQKVDDVTDNYCAYFMINCAHPTHFMHVLEDDDWMKRLGGIVVNASACSHEQLDDSLELDRGDPVKLGKQVKVLCKRYPQFRVIGGCCGTDFDHLHNMFSDVEM